MAHSMNLLQRILASTLSRLGFSQPQWQFEPITHYSSLQTYDELHTYIKDGLKGYPVYPLYVQESGTSGAWERGGVRVSPWGYRQTELICPVPPRSPEQLSGAHILIGLTPFLCSGC